MSNPVGAATGAAYTPSDMVAKAADKASVNKETFLQLLVAQIKNQNPLNPADGVEFLTQLAQFTELEQMMDVNTNLSDIKTLLADATTVPSETNP